MKLGLLLHRSTTIALIIIIRGVSRVSGFGRKRPPERNAACSTYLYKAPHGTGHGAGEYVYL